MGILVDAAGKPVPDVALAVIDDSGDGRMEISIEGPPPTSGADGTFRVERRAGPAILVVMVPPAEYERRYYERQYDDAQIPAAAC